MIRAGIAMYDRATPIKGQTYTRLHTCNATRQFYRTTQMHAVSCIFTRSYVIHPSHNEKRSNFARHFDQRYTEHNNVLVKYSAGARASRSCRFALHARSKSREFATVFAQKPSKPALETTIHDTDNNFEAKTYFFLSFFQTQFSRGPRPFSSIAEIEQHRSFRSVACRSVAFSSARRRSRLRHTPGWRGSSFDIENNCRGSL